LCIKSWADVLANLPNLGKIRPYTLRRNDGATEKSRHAK
jgi:hypothetical protein